MRTVISMRARVATLALGTAPAFGARTLGILGSDVDFDPHYLAIGGGIGRPDVPVRGRGMRGETGSDLLAQLKTRLGEGVPAIALTGYAREEDAARALYAGFRAHVAKPYELDDLCRQIQSLRENLDELMDGAR